MRQTLDELAREGARRMISAALEAEVEEYIAKRRAERDEQGHALVVRNGRAQERTVILGAGGFKLRAPRVHDRRAGERFSSRILPPYMRRSPQLEETLPVLYLRGLASGDFTEALSSLLGPQASGLSATTITRLLRVWQEEYAAWRKRSLQGKEYVYVWADGVYFGVRLEEDRLACLVIIGVLADGSKEVIALEQGYRESKESWAAVARELKERGLKAPVLAIGDGALGLWAAWREVYPQTREQRCWVHKIRNVLDKLPKRMQARAKSLLHEIMEAPDRASAVRGVERFAQEFEPRYPKAVECLRKDEEALLTFFDFPAEHWQHLRTTNPIESPFAYVKARTRQTKGAGSRQAGLALAFKLVSSAQPHWRKIHAPHLLALVQAGVPFRDGVQVRPPGEQNAN
jgi:transposase-like protein